MPSTLAPTDKHLACPSCGSGSLDVRPGTGPHHTRLVCKDCDKFIRWIGLPIDRDEAARFVMPYGKYKNVAMGELPQSYLLWLAANVEGRIARRAAVLLEGRPS